MSHRVSGHHGAGQGNPTAAPMTGFSWSPEGVGCRKEFFAALRMMPRKAGFGYPTFAKEGRKLVRSGALPGGPGGWPSDPLPRSSLNRAMKEEDWGWFSREPQRLEIFLRVATCPEGKVPAWLDKFRELDEDEEAEPGPEHDGQSAMGRSLVLRRTVLVLLVLAVLSGAYLLVLARYAEFYRVLGVSLGELPVGPGDLVLPTLWAVVLTAAVVITLVGFYTIGAALIPSPVPASLARPIAALCLVLYAAVLMGALYAGAYIGLLFPAVLEVVGGASTLVAAVLGVALLGSSTRLLTRDNATNAFIGWGLGLAVLAATAAPALGVYRWPLPQPWPLLVFLAGAAFAVLVLRRWIRREAGLLPAEERDEVSPATLFSRLRRDLSPVFAPRDIRPVMRRWEARRVVLGLLVLAATAPLAVLVGVAYVIGGAHDAGNTVREYGYLPPGHSSLALPGSVRPVTVALRQPGTDPVGVCQDPPAWAASLIAPDEGRNWVLLRPVEPGEMPPRVVSLPDTEYTVSLELTADTAEGDPWREPACGT